jgi:hypothetical protein
MAYKIFAVFLVGILSLILILSNSSISIFQPFKKSEGFSLSDFSGFQLTFSEDLLRVGNNSGEDLQRIKELYEIAPLLSIYFNKSKLSELQGWRCNLTKIEKLPNQRLNCECRFPLKKSSVIITFFTNSLLDDPTFTVGQSIRISGKIKFLYVFPIKEIAANIDIDDAKISK